VTIVHDQQKKSYNGALNFHHASRRRAAAIFSLRGASHHFILYPL
jgi:hypothetical protein